MANKEASEYRLMLIGLAAMGLTFSIVILGLSVRMLSTPNVLFPLLILMSIVFLAILLRALYPKTSDYNVQTYIGTHRDVNWASDNEDPRQSQTSQYQAYIELKHVLIDRVTIRMNMGREEWNRITTDRFALNKVLGDEDLIRLASLNEKVAVLPKNYRVEGIVLGPGFKKRFDLLLGKVEMWER